MAKPKPHPEQPGIALDSVAAHFQRQAAYFQNEALGLAAQVRELNHVIQQQAQLMALSTAQPPIADKPKPSRGKKPA